MTRVILGVSGASGAMLAMDCAKALRAAGVAVDLVVSAMAERTLALEIGPGALEALVRLPTGYIHWEILAQRSHRGHTRWPA